jgi:hypothetical protein
MEQVYQSWRWIRREMNVLFQLRISHVLRFISICELFTDSPPYYVKQMKVYGKLSCFKLRRFHTSDFGKLGLKLRMSIFVFNNRTHNLLSYLYVFLRVSLKDLTEGKVVRSFIEFKT